MREFDGADLFCGAGGFSTGLLAAARELGYRVRLLAVNHWDIAIETHSANHPEVTHLCESLDGVDPRKVVPGGRLRILMASPECTHHSNARGGKPMSDQSRATAWHILRWCEALYVENVLIENVREFRNWGPLGADGRPIKSMQGRLFRQFISSLRALGYTVEDRILCAADYGDATTRQRLFIQARRGRKKPDWPEPSHTGDRGASLFGDTAAWRPAREIIDWSLPGQSIYGRKRPLSPNTMRRILAGLEKFSGLQPYIIGMEHYGDDAKNGKRLYDMEKPLPVITGTSSDIFLAEPYLVQYNGTADAQSVGEPLGTVTGRDRFGLAQPEVIGEDGAAALVDIRFRMLQPHELAAAMSFPQGYHFAGRRDDQVKQIGNAVPVRLATALCRAMLG